jgi:hypothetical protein
MTVQPGGKVGLVVAISFDLKVTPPKTGVTVKERPFGRWQILFRILCVNCIPWIVEINGIKYSQGRKGK